MGLVSLINRLQQKKFIGGKKDSLMQARVSNKIKLVNGPRIKRLACGAHGNIFDLIAYKGNHKTKLVIKRYHSGNQIATAKKEFKILTSLRAKGYPTPPTFRLVRINGKYYIAMTDLTTIGDTLAKRFSDLPKEVQAENKDLLHKVGDHIVTAREDGLHLWDSFEWVYNSKTRKLQVFCFDLGNKDWEDRS